MEDVSVPVTVGNGLTVGTEPVEVGDRIGVGNLGTARQDQIIADFLDQRCTVGENHQRRLFGNGNCSKIKKKKKKKFKN